jgi:two-component system, LytTR family, response regulator
MKVIIVDDEPRAIDLLKGYLEHFSSMELVATFRNGLKAYEYISKEPVDLIFLDINMPHVSGISLSKMLPDHVKVIFTTAYSEYAVESYEIQAIDYLVKPISLERFTKSISRVLSHAEPAAEAEAEKNTIHVKSGSETFRLDATQILFLEKDGNYMTYHCAGRNVMARETIRESLEKLPDTFIQTHKSYIVNTGNVVSYDANILNMGKDKIPVSDSYREKVFRALKNS